ncbi:MAG: hypothetical protein EBR95_01030 [Verrucomicrobia bacterium]|nr:hypothetical protein [Verrucomicrobiota bacterium]
MRITLLVLAALASATFAADAPKAKFRPPSAAEVFDPKTPVLFADDFSTGVFSPKWRFSENANYAVTMPNPELIRIVDAPDLPGKKAVRFSVVRGPGVFRSEISLPHEKGWNERWYGERVLIPKEWVRDPAKPVDIVMQWHAIPGDFRATYPNVEISVGDDRWILRQSFGDPKTKPTRREIKFEDRVQPGVWTAWVIHAKWSPREDGLLQVWKDGKLVADLKGPNTYGTIGLEYTPYMKTGIYHPEWNVDKPGGRERFEADKPVAPHKIVYVTDLKVGDARAKYEDVAPR